MKKQYIKAKAAVWTYMLFNTWLPNNRFLIRIISILAKIWKTHFPKGIFRWNLAQNKRT